MMKTAQPIRLLQIASLWIGFVDVPSHGKLLKNMLAGVGGIMACFRSPLDEGVMPQTVQHVKILSLLEYAPVFLFSLKAIWLTIVRRRLPLLKQKSCSFNTKLSRWQPAMFLI
ncbi:MAG: hypothetical protein R3F51_13300 [Cyanobacteriota/Melainabacteria group bacterium]